MGSKFIHYCWFGGKPLPKLAKKCIKSWKKYLPDYEIIEWNETNVNLNECPFIKEAYENKKWAFVADYVRSKAIKEYGGIYFDTDMEIIKPIDELLKDDSFLGVEDSGCIACGVWWEKNPDSYLSNFLLNFYQSQKGFDVDNIYNISIPKLISKAMKSQNYIKSLKQVQILSNGTHIYTRDYFYPFSYDRQDNIFNDNTCMIHYYDASWVPKGEQKSIKLIRIFGNDGAKKIDNYKLKIKKIIKKTGKVLFYPIYKYKQNNKNKMFYENRLLSFKEQVNIFYKKDYIAFCNKDWLGTLYATKENFENVLPFHELNDGDNFKEYAKTICDQKVKLIIFSAFSMGWDKLIDEINKIDPNLKIKILWHGSNAMHCEDYDWKMFDSIINMLKEKKIYSIGFAKKSMYQYYKALGYNVEFVMNDVNLPKDLLNKKENKEKNDKIKIGLYASGNRWVKNFYNQFAGAALVKDAIIDCIPLNNRIEQYADLLNVNLEGKYVNISRKELIERMSQNDINLYCTFVECAPLLPLESMEMGVPCITGNNHHYWEGTELEKYLVVDKVDNSYEIYERINYCLENKEKIIELYKSWKKEYSKKSQESINNFIK